MGFCLCPSLPSGGLHLIRFLHSFWDHVSSSSDQLVPHAPPLGRGVQLQGGRGVRFLLLLGWWFGVGGGCWLLVLGPCLATLQRLGLFLRAVLRLYAHLGSSFSLLRLVPKAGSFAVNYCTFLPVSFERLK